MKDYSNSQVLEVLKKLRGTEVQVVADILLYLGEVSVRKFHLEMGYPSLYSFCEKELGYSKDEAYARIRAVELLRSHPGLASSFRAGQIGVTALMQAQVAFKRENSRRRDQKIPALTKSEEADVLAKLMNEPRGAKRTLAECFPDIPKDHEATKPVGNGLTLIQFAASQDELQDFERLKALLAHKNYSGKWRGLFKELAAIALEKLDPERNAKKESVREKQLSMAFVSKRKSRKYISIHTRRELSRRAGYRCQFVDEKTGLRCESEHGLQVDHRIPVAHGGTNEIHNLRILCGSHNRFSAWKAGLC